MIPLPAFQNQTILIFGLGKTGLSAARALQSSGAKILVWDDKETARASSGFPMFNPVNPGWGSIHGLLASPGIALTHPLLQQAKGAGVPFLNDLDILYQAQPNARFIGITGTNGKSTTTALTGHIFKTAGVDVAVGGNIGTPALSLPQVGFYALETSSYQLDLIQNIRFRAAAFLNLTPDHLERHGTMEGYLAAKSRIFRQQQPGDVAIVGVDDQWTRQCIHALEQKGISRIIPISAQQPLPQGVSCHDGMLRENGEERLDLRPLLRLPGAHNWQNVCAAFALARSQNLDLAAILDGIRTFPGLAHRQEFLGEKGGIRFVNDSKATNGDATARALACYPRAFIILGGVPKASGLDDVRPFFGHIVHAFTIGQAAGAFGETLAQANIPFTPCGTLDKATEAAAKMAFASGQPGDVVLLSPACASFDQFNNFEERGEAFRRAVHTIIA